MEEFLDKSYEFVTTNGLQLAINALAAIVILVIGFRIAGWLRDLLLKLMGKTERMDPAVAKFLANLAKYLVIAFTIIMVLEQFGVETTSLIAVLGAAGLAVGLALQGTLSNVAAGVMILMFRPFKIGQYVDAGGIAGSVKEIGLFTTELDTPDNVRITVPNSDIWGKAITNYSFHGQRRLDISCGIGYGDDIAKARQVMLDTAKADGRVLGDPQPTAFVDSLGDSSVNLTVRFWCTSADYWQLKWDMTEAIKCAFDKEKIEIPFPQRVVTMIAQGGAPNPDQH